MFFRVKIVPFAAYSGINEERGESLEKARTGDARPLLFHRRGRASAGADRSFPADFYREKPPRQRIFLTWNISNGTITTVNGRLFGGRNMYLEISNPTDYRAALYIRLSREDENEGPSESVSNQQSLLNEFVQQHRLIVFDTYIDDGWSGTNFVEVR